MTVPKPAPFDAATFQEALDENIRRSDGKPYAVFSQFRDWKLWADKLRDYVEANRKTLVDHKADLDKHAAELAAHEARLDALEVATPQDPFPGSG